MAKRKRQKTFFKVKEKLVLVPPKKFFGRKVVGVICLALGSLVMAFYGIYYYFLPRILPGQIKDVVVEENTLQFVANRVIILEPGVDLRIKDDLVEEAIAVSLNKFKEDQEIILFGQDSYRVYKIVKVESKVSSASGTLSLGDYGLRLILPVKVKPAKVTIIDAELSL